MAAVTSCENTLLLPARDKLYFSFLWDEDITFYYIDTDEIPGFFLLLKNHIFIELSEDTIFIFHV